MENKQESPLYACIFVNLLMVIYVTFDAHEPYLGFLIIKEYYDLLRWRFYLDNYFDEVNAWHATVNETDPY